MWSALCSDATASATICSNFYFLATAQLLSLLLDVWYVSPVSGLSGKCLALSFPWAHGTRRLVYCCARGSCAAACCSSSERRCAAQISKLQAMRVKQNNEFGPIRAPENNDFWRPTTAKLPLRVQVSSPQPTKHAFHIIPICWGLIPLHNPQIVYVQSYTIKYEYQCHWNDWRRLQGCTALGRRKRKTWSGHSWFLLVILLFTYLVHGMELWVLRASLRVSNLDGAKKTGTPFEIAVATPDWPR